MSEQEISFKSVDELLAAIQQESSAERLQSLRSYAEAMMSGAPEGATEHDRGNEISQALGEAEQRINAIEE